MKICTKCKATKPLSEFGYSKGKIKGHCKECHRGYYIKKGPSATYLPSIKVDLKEGDKFVAYERKTGRKALWGGVCEACSTYNSKGDKLPPVSRGKKGEWLTVTARDWEGQIRIFGALRRWGFLKRI